MGITRASVALPLRRLPDKQVSGTRHGGSFEALRVPWFDEDALTLALDAGLALGPALDRAEHVVLALDEGHDQAGLVPLALDLEVPVSTRIGPLSGLKALGGVGGEPSLLLSGGSRVGGAGVALVLEPGEGVPVEAIEQAYTAPLASQAGSALERVAGQLPGSGPLRVPAGVSGRGAVQGRSAGAWTASVGDVGASGPLVEIAGALEEGGPVRVAATGNGLACGVELGSGSVPVDTVPGSWVDVSVGEVKRLREADPVPWSEASQGAYVSREEYEADPGERYGARALGRGRVAAVTTIHAGPPGEFVRQHEASGAYDVVIVEDGGGRRIHQSAVPPGEVSIGDEVERVVRRLFSLEDRWRYAVKVRPV